MQIDQALIIAVVGALCSAIVSLFWIILKAKDAYIAHLLETIKYQRAMGGQALGTAHRAVEMADRVS